MNEEKRGGRVHIQMVRHGKQFDYEQPGSDLSPEGEDQARAYAEALLAEFEGQEVIFKVKASTVGRASNTGKIVTETLSAIIQKKNIADMRVLKFRHSTHLKTVGGIGPLVKAGIRYHDAMDEWLMHSSKYPEARSPAEIDLEIRGLVGDAIHLQNRVGEYGPKIVYIWVTHETAGGAVMNQLTGKTTKDLGGPIGHLEPMKIDLGEEEPVVRFRSEKSVLAVDGSKMF